MGVACTGLDPGSLQVVGILGSKIGLLPEPLSHRTTMLQVCRKTLARQASQAVRWPSGSGNRQNIANPRLLNLFP